VAPHCFFAVAAAAAVARGLVACGLGLAGGLEGAGALLRYAINSGCRNSMAQEGIIRARGGPRSGCGWVLGLRHLVLYVPKPRPVCDRAKTGRRAAARDGSRQDHGPNE
jgi:hypothetical protein